MLAALDVMDTLRHCFCCGKVASSILGALLVLQSIHLFVGGGNPQPRSSKETAENFICEYCVCTTMLFPEMVEPGVIMVLGCYFIVVYVFVS